MESTPDKKEERQVILRNTCEGLEKGSVLEQFAKKLQDGYEITLTPKEVKKLVLYVNTLKHGFSASVPLICTGEKCPYASKCPLGENNNYPIGKECPIESTLTDIWYSDYIKDLEVDPDNRVDTALVGDVVFWEILEKRAAEELAKKPEIIRRNVAGFQDTKDGVKPIYREEMNQIINFLEKAQKQKLKVLNALIATREAKAKDVSRIISDPSTYASKLLDKAKELKGKAADLGMVEGETKEAYMEDDTDGEYGKVAPS
jgi:hypothetical protein